MFKIFTNRGNSFKYLASGTYHDIISVIIATMRD